MFAELSGTAPVTRLAKATDGPALPFFEAYFSNFIEGTEFAVNKAADILFRGLIPKARAADAHDVLGNSDEVEMKRIPRAFDELVAFLKTRHSLIMEGRPEQGAGQFKTDANRAGSTEFVAPDLVTGTLAQGFDMYRGLTSPLHRAIFMMFLISEVHPFADGNGRAARIMMNAELVSAGESRIIAPTVYRNNYLMALKALSQNKISKALVRTIDFVQRYTVAVDFSNVDRVRLILEKTQAFVDPNEADARGIHLHLPTADILADAE